jgi:hypothetical protein
MKVPLGTTMTHNTGELSGRKIASFEELAYSNMLVNEALVSLLTEKGVISQQEVIERISRLRGETRIQKPTISTNRVVASREDLIASNSFVVELMFDLLCEKEFLTVDEISELKARLKQRAKELLRTQ